MSEESAAVSRGTVPKDDSDNRKLVLLQRSGLFGADTRGAVIERACNLEDLRKAYRLVHEIYLRTGFVNPEPSGVRLRIFETTSETATFIAKKDGEVIGVLSVVGDSSDLGLPSDAAFKPELDSLRITGARLCEITNQVVAENYRRSAVSTELMRCAIAHQIKAGYHHAIASVSPSHNGFYDFVGFKAIGSLRSYSEKLHDPVIAVGLSIDAFRCSSECLTPTAKFFHDFVTVLNPFREKVGGWARQAVNQFLNPELLKQLFFVERNFLGECSAAELTILQRRWGQEIYGTIVNATYPPFMPVKKTLAPEIVPLPSPCEYRRSPETQVPRTASPTRALRRPLSPCVRRTKPSQARILLTSSDNL